MGSYVLVVRRIPPYPRMSFISSEGISSFEGISGIMQFETFASTGTGVNTPGSNDQHMMDRIQIRSIIKIIYQSFAP